MGESARITTKPYTDTYYLLVHERNAARRQRRGFCIGIVKATVRFILLSRESAA